MNADLETVTIWEIDPISTILQKIHFKHTTKDLRTISIVSEYRLEGKTTVAMLLARGLSEVYKFKILLIDLNPNGDALLNQYLKDYEKDNTKDGIVVGHPFPFAIFRLKNLDISWLKNTYDGLYTNQLISQFSTQYDLIIVDTMTTEIESEVLLRANTQSTIMVTSEKSMNGKSNKLQAEFELNKKELLGIIYNQ